MQAQTRRVKAHASADLVAKRLHKCGLGGSRSGQGRIRVQRKCTGLHGRATGMEAKKVGVHQRLTRESEKAKDDGPVIPRGADGNQYLAIGDQI